MILSSGVVAVFIGMMAVWDRLPIVPLYPLCPTPEGYQLIKDKPSPAYLAAFKRTLVRALRHDTSIWIDLPGRPVLVSRLYYHYSGVREKYSLYATIVAAERTVGYRLKSAHDEYVLARLENSCVHLRMIVRGEIPSRHDLRWWE